MAAGSGSRYGKLKQFDELGPSGEFLMEFSIYDAIQSGFNHIVLITRKENKDFLYNYLRQRIDSTIKIDVVVQGTTNLPIGMIADPKREKPWGTAHAVWCAKDFIFDVSSLASDVGIMNWHDHTSFNLGEFPFTNDFLELYSYKLTNLISAIQGNIKKVLILDLDDTIWGGNVGDLGYEGIKIGFSDPESKSFLDLER